MVVELDDHDTSWIVNGIYGWTDRASKFKTWDLMRSMAENVQLPYVFFGDFNEILALHEKEGGAHRNERDICAFRSCIDDCNLVDSGFRGSCFIRFESFWLSKDGCSAVVSKAWNEGANFSISARLETCANSLKDWVAKAFGETKRLIKLTKKKLTKVQKQTPNFP